MPVPVQALLDLQPRLLRRVRAPTPAPAFAENLPGAEAPLRSGSWRAAPLRLGQVQRRARSRPLRSVGIQFQARRPVPPAGSARPIRAPLPGFPRRPPAPAQPEFAAALLVRPSDAALPACLPACLPAAISDIGRYLRAGPLLRGGLPGLRVGAGEPGPLGVLSSAPPASRCGSEGPMLPRTWRLLPDGGGRGAGVTLSAFRSRVPEFERGPPALQPAPVTLREEARDGVIFTVSSRAPEGARSGEGSRCCEEEAAVSAVGPGASTPSQSRALKAGLLPQLVWHLLEAPTLGDASYVPAFLATYRTFTTTHVVLRLLLDRLQALAVPGSDVPLERTQFQHALGSLLCSWLEGHPKDFAELEPGLQEELLLRLRWALGDGSGPEKTLCEVARGASPAVREGASEDEDIADEGDPDPHYILGLQAEDVAAHLTWQDAELFLHLAPHECLGSLWSQRDKKGHEGACPTVRATVAQFNRVANAVVASCLGDTGLRATQRARLLEKWIRVAEECLWLRNFSSLYAVVSALQSSPLHRLKRTWEETAKDSIRCYEELSAVCSEEDNYRQSRRLLFQEAAADSTQWSHQQRISEQRPMGVVPYLGMFLKDLVMLDAAARDQLQNGYINFEKHRKEFEILTQLRLLQATCRNYTLQRDRTFQRWLQRLPRLSEAQSYQLSCTVEPPGEGMIPTRLTKPTLVVTRCTDLLCSVGTSHFSYWDKPSPSQAPPDLLLPPVPASPLTQHMKWPSVSALDTVEENLALRGIAPPPVPEVGFVRGHRRSASCGTAYPRAPASGGASPSDCCIIRVRLELQNGTLYKSILVTSQDKTPAVVAKVLEKHNQDQSLALSYELVQLLPEGRELVFPPMANVFYAMNSSSLDFMLRLRCPQWKLAPSPPRLHSPQGVEISATFPKIKATGRKIAKVLFSVGGGYASGANRGPDTG